MINYTRIQIWCNSTTVIITKWGEKDSIRYFKHPIYGIIKAWNDWESKDEITTYQTFYQVLHTDKRWVASSQISFPKKEEIFTLLDLAGLSVKHLYGDWPLNPYADKSDEMIFVGSKGITVLNDINLFYSEHT